MGYAVEQGAVSRRRMEIGETVSALMDGNVDKIDSEVAYCQALMPEGKACWDEYHLISDALNSSELLEIDVGRSGVFMAHFSAAFENEPYLLTPQVKQPSQVLLWARRAVPTTVVAVAAATVTWFVVPNMALQSPGTTVAIQTDQNMGSGQIVNVSQVDDNNTHGRAVMLRDASLDDYLRAHGQFASRPAAPYMRAAIVSQED